MQTNTLLINSKPVKQWANVEEPGKFDYPYLTTLDGVKVELSWDEKEELELLKLDGVLYANLPYISDDFRLDD